MENHFEKRVGTRQVIMRATQKLAEKNSFENVTVTAICKKCGINRTLFYYHFIDKFDVVNQIYKQKTDSLFEKSRRSGSWKTFVHDVLSYIKENKQFYENMLRMSGQNSFGDFLYEYTYQLNLKIVEEKYMELTGNGDIPTELLCCVSFYSSGCVGMVGDWIRKGMSFDIELVAEKYCNCIPEELKIYFTF